MADAATASRIEREKPLRDELMNAGITAADEWLAPRAHRHMSEVNRRRLVGHVVNALWDQIVDAALGIAHMINEDFEAERDRLRAEVEQLRRPLMVVQVDADLSEEDVARFRARWAEATADGPQVMQVAPAQSLRLVEWTLGDDDAPFDATRVYAEADARRRVADPHSTNVLWTREATAWRKADVE